MVKKLARIVLADLWYIEGEQSVTSLDHVLNFKHAIVFHISARFFLNGHARYFLNGTRPILVWSMYPTNSECALTQNGL